MRRLAALALLSAAPLAAATYTVTNTNDSGAGSLRQAILDANGNAGADLIHFAIPGSDTGCDGSGVCTVAPASTLQINDGVTIDGDTQSGATPNSATHGTNAALRIVLSGVNMPGSTMLAVGAGGTTIRGLVINNSTIGIDGLTTGDIHIEGCFFGTDASGMSAASNGESIEFYIKTTGSTVGGPALAQRNLIGSSTEGVSGSAAGTVIQNNLFGTDATGAAVLPQLPGGNAVNIGACSEGDATDSIIDNVIGTGFAANGIITQCLPATIQGKHIGVDATGAVAFPPHMQYGIEPSDGSIVGGTDPGQGNVVANMSWAGIVTAGGNTGPIRGNSIYNNGGDPLGTGLGIDVANDGVNRNDPGDSDFVQNFPLLKSVTTGATTHVIAVLHSAASTGYDIDFYANPACSNFPRDFDEGQTYLGNTHVTTNGSGDADIDVVLPAATETGARITMTATNTALGHTSEFSQRLPFSVFPAGAPAAGGTAFTVSGTDFAAGATVTMGGAAATSVVVSNDHTITASSPALTAGSVNDLVVTNTDGTSGTLVKGWVSDFLDVNGGNQFYAFVTTLVSNAITVGVGGGNYGVDAPTLRQQMAVFLLKAEHGLCYTPPACSGVFSDVPCSSPFAPWIEQMAAEGITGGCGAGVFCPTNPVRRDQMAVFLLKGEHGSSYAPPACAGTFADVPCPSTFANWIEQLAAEQITGGCGGGNYCPLNPNTRGQMAVFITKTFNLQ